MGVPVIIGSKVSKIVDISLTKKRRACSRKSAQSVQSVVDVKKS